MGHSKVTAKIRFGGNARLRSECLDCGVKRHGAEAGLPFRPYLRCPRLPELDTGLPVLSVSLEPYTPIARL